MAAAICEAKHRDNFPRPIHWYVTEAKKRQRKPSHGHVHVSHRTTFVAHSPTNIFTQAPEPRIINGDQVTTLRYPYFGLMYGDAMCGTFFSRRRFGCVGRLLSLWLKNNLLNPRSDLPGATLIGPKLLLTAAHCINAHSKVRVGAYDSHEDGYEVAITKKVPHPSYNRDKGRANDVMLISIETTTPHPFIKLCREKVTDGRLTVIGFGSTASIGREISPPKTVFAGPQRECPGET